MTKEEESLLLFLETQIVDHRCLVGEVHMNDDDMKIAKRWDKKKYIVFGRLKMRDIPKSGKRSPHYGVQFSETAWSDAHRIRRERGHRICSKVDLLPMLCGHRDSPQVSKGR